MGIIKYTLRCIFFRTVYNKLELTKECYRRIRLIYPEIPFVISSGGSSDGTKEWLESLNDDYLSYIHDDDRLTFSDTYNSGIKLVDTEKLVLIHNDMVIGEHFLENLDRLLDENPFFDKIDLGTIPDDYIENEQKNTNYDLRSKFTLSETVDVMIYETSPFTDEDIYNLMKIRLSIPHYEPGQYQMGNMLIEIKRNFN